MTKRQISPISSCDVNLRLLQVEDLPLTLRWRNQDHIRCWFFNPAVITIDQHIAWFQQNTLRDDDFVFIFEAKQEAGFIPIGQTSLYKINWEKKQAEFGRLMVGEPGFTGKGLAKKASVLTLRIAFNYWLLDEVVTFILSSNQRSIGICHAVGFEDIESDGKIIKMVLGRSRFCNQDL